MTNRIEGTHTNSIEAQKDLLERSRTSNSRNPALNRCLEESLKDEKSIPGHSRMHHRHNKGTKKPIS